MRLNKLEQNPYAVLVFPSQIVPMIRNSVSIEHVQPKKMTVGVSNTKSPVINAEIIGKTSHSFASTFDFYKSGGPIAIYFEDRLVWLFEGYVTDYIIEQNDRRTVTMSIDIAANDMTTQHWTY